MVRSYSQTLAACLAVALAGSLAGCGDDGTHHLADGGDQPDARRIDASDHDGPSPDGTAPDAPPDALLPAVCGDHHIEAGESCDDGNTMGADGCSALCAREVNEVEPNDDGTPDIGGGEGSGGGLLRRAGARKVVHVHRAVQRTIRPAIDINDSIAGNDFGDPARANIDANDAFDTADGNVDIYAALTPEGDEDGYAFTNSGSAAAIVQLDTWDAGSGFGVGVPCGIDIDTGLDIHDSDGNIVFQNDDRDGSMDRCSTGSWTILPGEKIYAHVVAFDDDVVIPAYVLQVRFTIPVCGNGVVEGTEQCDDNNAMDGDGCSSSCQVEGVTPETEPNDSVGSANPTAVGMVMSGSVTGSDVDTYELVVAADTVVRMQTFTALAPLPVCHGNIDLAVLDSTGTLISDDDADELGTCGGMVLPLTAGTYYIQLTGEASYLLGIEPVTSDGAETEAAGATGDNETTQTAEVSFGATPPLDSFVSGDIGVANDVDVFAVAVPAGAAIRAETIEGTDAAGACENDGIDTVITLYDQDGNFLTSDDDGGRGTCSLIDGLTDTSAVNTTGADQVWFVEVDGFSTETPSYKLVVSVH